MTTRPPTPPAHVVGIAVNDGEIYVVTDDGRIHVWEPTHVVSIDNPQPSKTDWFVPQEHVRRVPAAWRELPPVPGTAAADRDDDDNDGVDL